MKKRSEVESYVPTAAFYEGKRELPGEEFSDRFAVLDPADAFRVIASRGEKLTAGAILPVSKEDADFAMRMTGEGKRVVLLSAVGVLFLFGDAAANGLIPALLPEGEADDLAESIRLLGRTDWIFAPSVAEKRTDQGKRAHRVSEVCRNLATDLAKCERLFQRKSNESFRAHCAEVAAFAGCRADVRELPTGMFPLDESDQKLWTVLLLCLFLSLRGAGAEGPTVRMKETGRETLLTGMEYHPNRDSAKRDPERLTFLQHKAFGAVELEKTAEGYRFSVVLRSRTAGTQTLRAVTSRTRVQIAVCVGM